MTATVVETRKHVGTRAPGTYAAYRKDRCRCYPCCAARQEYADRRAAAQAAGTWQPYTDAEPVRQHVRALAAAGIGAQRAAHLAGLTTRAVETLMKHTPGHTPSPRMRTETARKLLALRPVAAPDLAHDHCPVDGTGFRRRMRSLVARGFPQTYLARRLGIVDTTLSLALSGGRVTAATHRAGRALYDALWDCNPADHGIAPHTVTRARLAAQRRGWPLPLAWDDDTIDDPAALPDLGAPAGRAEALAEDAAFVARTVGGDRAAIAERLGISRKYLEKALSRTGTAIPTLEGAAA